MPVRAIVTDIEGTTSSIAFVKDVLFPYAAKAIPGYVRSHRDSPEVAAILDATAAESNLSREDIEALIRQLLTWIAEDRKTTPLKALQGLVWRTGYEQGAYCAHVYPDAVDALRIWHGRGIPLYVYSSGSIAAQKLFFRYSEAGDLTTLFSGYFDTTTGPKRERNSYETIAAAIGLPPEDILFLSDIDTELDAAAAAGFQTYWLQRPHDTGPSIGTGQHPIAKDFHEIIDKIEFPA